MPAPRVANQWPTGGERNTRCTLQYATVVIDAMGGREDPTWTTYGTWWAKVVTVPTIQNEVESAILYQAEGPYRSDFYNYFAGGTGQRLIANGITLKVFQVENPLLQNRTLIAHCAPAVTAQ